MQSTVYSVRLRQIPSSDFKGILQIRLFSKARSKMTKILCVAEKPSISKAVAGHLSGGQVTTRNTRSQYIKNYCFEFDFGRPWGRCEVTMTAVLGHLTKTEFGPEYKNWRHPPPDSLFNAPILTSVDADKKPVAENIEQQARHCQALFIWTDCDREGEHIGGEIRASARKGNPGIQVKRAQFSNIERAHILNAAKNLRDLDDRQVDAVSARIDLDLRTGYAFTRFLTNSLQPMGGPLERAVMSYGSCQFPTLGFVVDRYFKVQNFVPEAFWSIKVVHKKEGKTAIFNWAKNRLFDRAAVTILFERCLAAKQAKVVKVQEKPTKKWKPLPLTTVELQKMATRFLQMTGQQAMTVAEALYNKGFISYPRTETDRFDKGINLQALVQKQTEDNRWGNFAQDLVDGNFQQPREGRHDDKAHPPIHPIAYAAPGALDENAKRLYEFVVRRFLACCSDDAKGQSTDIEIKYGDESFHSHGVVVLERNYLDVYPYENWHDSAELPSFTVGERFEPTEANMTEGKTTPPGYLTEADLIALMDANGIGTDATMAEHIERIQLRDYVKVVDRAQPAGEGGLDGDADADDGPATRGGRGGRGRGSRGGRGGRGGTAARGGGRSVKVFIPTQLGVALIQGFDNMHHETSLGKPFLRKEMELKIKEICDGRMTKDQFLREEIHQYRNVFDQSMDQLDVLKAACRRYIFQQQQ